MGKLCDRCSQAIWDNYLTCVKCRLAAEICTLDAANPCLICESWSTITWSRLETGSIADLDIKDVDLDFAAVTAHSQVMQFSVHQGPFRRHPPLMRVRPRPWIIWSPRRKRRLCPLHPISCSLHIVQVQLYPCSLQGLAFCQKHKHQCAYFQARRGLVSPRLMHLDVLVPSDPTTLQRFPTLIRRPPTLGLLY